jgi:hypothetical protein
MISKIVLLYKEASWPQKLEKSHASQILTNVKKNYIHSESVVTFLSNF